MPEWSRFFDIQSLASWLAILSEDMRIPAWNAEETGQSELLLYFNESEVVLNSGCETSRSANGKRRRRGILGVARGRGHDAVGERKAENVRPHAPDERCPLCKRPAQFLWRCPCGFRMCQSCMDENLWGLTCNFVTWTCPDCGRDRSF